MGLVLGLLGCGGGSSDQPSRRMLSIATAPPGGGWYVMGGVLSSLINDAVPNVQTIPESTGGAEENVRIVGSGQADLGFVIIKTALQGYRGEAPFSQSFSDLRMLFANLEVGRIHTVVTEESPLQDICELIGIDFEPQMIGDYSVEWQKLPESFQQMHTNLRKGPSNEQCFKWRTTLSRPDQAIAYELAGSLLEDLGYETGAKHHPLKVARKFYHRVRESFAWRIRQPTA